VGSFFMHLCSICRLSGGNPGKRGGKAVGAVTPKAFLVRQFGLRYQGKGVFCKHTFFEAKAAGVLVCLGDFPLAEPFERADGIIG